MKLEGVVGREGHVETSHEKFLEGVPLVLYEQTVIAQRGDGTALGR
jgi:hypothetical protein